MGGSAAPHALPRLHEGRLGPEPQTLEPWAVDGGRGRMAGLPRALCAQHQAGLGLAGQQGSTVPPGEPLSCLCPQSCLEFSLRIQEFIELIRQNKRLDAVRCAARWAHGVRTGSHAREG